MTTHRPPRTAPDNEPTNHDSPRTALLTTPRQLLPLNPSQLAAHRHTRLRTFGT